MKLAKKITVTLLLTMCLTACSPSIDDLTDQVKENMTQKLKSSGISITSLILTKKGGNEYSGVLETKEPSGNFSYNVDVVYDGKSFTWSIRD